MNKKIIIKLILVILWMSVIFIFSSQNGMDSSKLSQGITYRVVELIKGKYYPEDKNCHGIDEDGHITSSYDIAVMSRELLMNHRAITNYTTIWMDSLRNGESELVSTNKLILYTIIICMLYAITDELHQGFISGRAARVFDVFIDTCGSTLSTSIMYIGNKLKIKNK